MSIRQQPETEPVPPASASEPKNSPVTKDASSETRNDTSLATSSGCPMRSSAHFISRQDASAFLAPIGRTSVQIRRLELTESLNAPLGSPVVAAWYSSKLSTTQARTVRKA